MSREEYVDLMKMLRPKVSERLGVSTYLVVKATTLIFILAIASIKSDDSLAIRSVHHRRENGHRGRSTVLTV